MARRSIIGAAEVVEAQSDEGRARPDSRAPCRLFAAPAALYCVVNFLMMRNLQLLPIPTVRRVLYNINAGHRLTGGV